MAQLPIANLFADRDELLDQLPETVIFVQLLAGLLHGRAGRNDPSHGLAGNRVSEGESEKEGP